jgi:hypothetical protein
MIKKKKNPESHQNKNDKNSRKQNTVNDKKSEKRHGVNTLISGDYKRRKMMKKRLN